MTSLSRRFQLRSLAALLVGSFGLAGHRIARPQTSPSKVVRFVVGSPAGALGDILARLVGGQMAESLAQSVVIENKPGAGLVIAADAVARSAADGNTVFVTVDSALVINPYVYKKLPYDASSDFRAVGLIGRATHLLLVKADSSIKRIQDLMELAKAQPGQLNYASPGVGHSNHLIMEMVWNRLGISLTHIPYKGTSECVLAVINGQTQVTITGLVEALPLIKDGKLRAIATSGPLAKSAFPNLPMLKEVHQDLDFGAWFGLFVPKATSDATVLKLNGALNSALSREDVKNRLLELGVAAMPGPAEALDRLVLSDQRRWAPLVKNLGIKLD